MIRKLILLATLSVLLGVFVLSTSAYADSGSSAGKVTNPAVSQQVSPAKPTSTAAVAKAPAFSTIMKNSVGFWLRHLFGLPPVHTETKPPDNGEPLKSVGEKGNSDNWTGKPMTPDIAKDHGGSYVDI